MYSAIAVFFAGSLILFGSGVGVVGLQTRQRLLQFLSVLALLLAAALIFLAVGFNFETEEWEIWPFK